MRKPGIVKSGGKICEVSVMRQSACGENCAHCKGGCTPTDTVITAENTVGAKAGDRVMLEMPDKTGIKAAALVYLLPIAVLIIGVISAYSLGLSEGEMALAALGVLAVSMAFVALINRRFSADFKVKVVRILGRENDVE